MLNPGDVAGPGAPVMQIEHIQSLVLEAGLPPADGRDLRAGQTASIRDVAGQEIPARVLNIGQVDPQSGLLLVRLHVDNTRRTLRVGEFVTASIIVRTVARAVTVSHDAVLRKDGRTVVYRVEPGPSPYQGVARQTPVKTGIASKGRVEIVEGLRARVTVVRLGHYEIEDGAAVHTGADAASAAVEASSPASAAPSASPRESRP